MRFMYAQADICMGRLADWHALWGLLLGLPWDLPQGPPWDTHKRGWRLGLFYDILIPTGINKPEFENRDSISGYCHS